MVSWIQHLGLNLTLSQRHTRGGGAQSSAQRALGYFSQVTKDQVEELYNIYKLDFLLFSYTPNIFINVAKDEPLINMELYETAKYNQISKTNVLNKRFGSLIA